MMSDDPTLPLLPPGGFGPPLRTATNPGAESARTAPRCPPPMQPESLAGGPAEFTRRVERLLAECRRWRLTLVVLRMKLQSAGGGSQAESALADEMANRVRARVRANDAVVRVGVDEVGALLTGAGEGAVDAIAERLRRALAEPYAIGGLRVEAVVQFGHSVYPGHALSADSLVRAATPRR
jgi:GGDEF domain-containing protein